MEHINNHNNGKIDEHLKKVGLNLVWLNMLKIKKRVKECAEGELKVETIDANINISPL